MVEGLSGGAWGTSKQKETRREGGFSAIPPKAFLGGNPAKTEPEKISLT